MMDNRRRDIDQESLSLFSLQKTLNTKKETPNQKEQTNKKGFIPFLTLLSKHF